MGLEVATYISQLIATNPASTDPKSQGDDHLRLVKAALKTTFPNADKPFYFPEFTTDTVNQTPDATAINRKYGLDATAGELDVTLPNTLVAGDAGWFVDIQKVDASANAIVVSPASGTINGVASISLSLPFAYARFVWTGTTWYAYVGGQLGTAAIVDESITLAKLADEIVKRLVPAGTALWDFGTTAPDGYVYAFGQNLSRTTYASLFTRFSTTYGAGDGSTTFTMPDVRGRVIAGKDDMGGTSANRLTGLTGGLNGDNLGATGGVETHTLTIAQMPLHGHPFRLAIQSAGSASSNTTGGLLLSDSVLTDFPAHTGVPGTPAGQQIGGSGGGGAHNNVQPTIIANLIVCTGGV